MNVKIDKSFDKDIDNIRDKHLLKKLQNVIAIIENAQSLAEIPNVKKIKGYSSYYRIRVGDYRLGFEEISGQGINLIRFLHRKEVYRYFP
ncbi:MAG: type II toxin-antitoxin system RelE family toxin [Ignavibacteriaceae bacterium]